MGLLCSRSRHHTEDTDVNAQAVEIERRIEQEAKAEKHIRKLLLLVREENQQLNWFKNKVTKQNKHAKVLEESLGILSEKLRKTAEDNRIVRQTTKMQHEQNRERAEELSSFIVFQEKDMEEFVEEREKLIKEQEKKMAYMNRGITRRCLIWRETLTHNVLVFIKRMCCPIFRCLSELFLNIFRN
ncbi:unnamed protein product [Microthlaspi erraticum]|uniref:Uncharacterized protein n=1 Tax=Microthlaspi erraticum TaxID=1685480 RepID=A0A6D2JR54_9BRAS|nr:unnamed protein product [Microthlaspi erraticum]